MNHKKELPLSLRVNPGKPQTLNPKARIVLGRISRPVFSGEVPSYALAESEDWLDVRFSVFAAFMIEGRRFFFLRFSSCKGSVEGFSFIRCEQASRGVT